MNQTTANSVLQDNLGSNESGKFEVMKHAFEHAEPLKETRMNHETTGPQSNSWLWALGITAGVAAVSAGIYFFLRGQHSKLSR